jgi:hypothetical protein
MSEPRPFNLDDEDERIRLIHEIAGYIRVSRKQFINDGTDQPGRQYAYEAIQDLSRGLRERRLSL